MKYLIFLTILYKILIHLFFYRRQLLKLKTNGKTNGSRSMKDTNDKSINFQKSIESLDTMDSKISTQTIQCLEPISDTGMYYENVDNCDDNNTFVMDNKALLNTLLKRI